MLPPEPPSARRATGRAPAPEPAWWWRLETASGEVVESSVHSSQRFESQAEAESWVGEVFADLAAEGVDAVTLFEVDRAVYGPMSLHA